MAKKRLGQVLLDAGLIDGHQLQAALGEQRRHGNQLGKLLVNMGLASEEDIVRALSEQLNIPSVNLEWMEIDTQALNFLDADFCRHHQCIPFHYDGRGQFLDVAIADPTVPGLIDEIRVQSERNIRPHLAGPVAIDVAIRAAYFGERRRRATERLEEITHEDLTSPGISSGPPPPPNRRRSNTKIKIAGETSSYAMAGKKVRHSTEKVAVYVPPKQIEQSGQTVSIKRPQTNIRRQSLAAKPSNALGAEAEEEFSNRQTTEVVSFVVDDTLTNTTNTTQTTTLPSDASIKLIEALRQQITDLQDRIDRGERSWSKIGELLVKKGICSFEELLQHMGD